MGKNEMEIKDPKVDPMAVYTDPQALDTLLHYAEIIAKSGLFPAIRTRDQAFTLMQLSQAEKLPPIVAMRRYHIIEGRPTMRADAMHAEFMRIGGKIRFTRRDEEECSATFVYDGQELEVSVKMEDMKKRGIVQGKSGVKDNWRKWPRQMLHARCVSEGIRSVAPQVVTGIYAPGEEDYMMEEPRDIEIEPNHPKLETPDAPTMEQAEREDPQVKPKRTKPVRPKKTKDVTPEDSPESEETGNDSGHNYGVDRSTLYDYGPEHEELIDLIKANSRARSNQGFCKFINDRLGTSIMNMRNISPAAAGIIKADLVEKLAEEEPKQSSGERRGDQGLSDSLKNLAYFCQNNLGMSGERMKEFLQMRLGRNLGSFRDIKDEEADRILDQMKG